MRLGLFADAPLGNSVGRRIENIGVLNSVDESFSNFDSGRIFGINFAKVDSRFFPIKERRFASLKRRWLTPIS